MWSTTFILDPIIDTWNLLHPAIQLLISLGLISQFVRRSSAIINAIIKGLTGKDSIFQKPQVAIDHMRVWIVRSIRRTVRNGLSYWFPKKEVKKAKVTHWIKIIKGDLGYYYRELQDLYNKRVIYNWREFDTDIEASGDAREMIFQDHDVIDLKQSRGHIFLGVNLDHLDNNDIKKIKNKVK